MARWVARIVVFSDIEAESIEHAREIVCELMDSWVFDADLPKGVDSVMPDIHEIYDDDTVEPDDLETILKRLRADR